MPLLALAGQGATFALTRLMGQPPQQNFVYRLFEVVASPVVKPCRWIAPRFIPDRHLPLVAFSLLLVAYGWVMLEIAARLRAARAGGRAVPAVAMKSQPAPGDVDQAAAWCVLFRRRDIAIAWYRRMLELDPADTLALASIGFQYAQLGRKRDALAHVRSHRRRCKPDDAEAHFNRGFLLQELGDPEAAMAAFRQALEANPGPRPRALRSRAAR